MGYAIINPHREQQFSYKFGTKMPFLRRWRSDCGLLPPPRLWLNPIPKVVIMIKKKILNPDRIRRITAGFSFIPHRFLGDGFLSSLQQEELLLYLFLVIVSDRHGLSFYSYDAICSLLQMALDQYMAARDALIDKDLIAFDGTVFQVLDLPAKPVLSAVSKCPGDPSAMNQAIAGRLIDQCLKRM
jgi:hypothetical protein